MSDTDWHIFKGNPNEPHGDWQLPDPPSWRPFGRESRPGESRRQRRGETFQATPDAIASINAALYLRRPLLVTGKPGTGKSSLAYAVARELELGEVLYWPITTRTTLKSGLYDYDAIGRLQDAKQQERFPPEDGKERENLELAEIKSIENYITLGPLGTALLPSEKPRVLLIDEIDKSDIDLPNDLLAVLEEGRFEIPELVRIKQKVPKVTVRTAYLERPDAPDWQRSTCEISEGSITCTEFPLIVMTSNGERAFPPPFLRRCLRLTLKLPDRAQLQRIIEAHLAQDLEEQKKAIAQAKGTEAAQKWHEDARRERETLIEDFERKCKNDETIATDQLLNAIFMVTRSRSPIGEDKDTLIRALMKELTSAED